jgi:hypothetical protein
MAFFLLVMLAFIGLGADMARLMATRNQLQGAADAAALAGASVYETSSSDPVPVIAAVKARASEWALKNKAFEGAPTAVSVPDSDIVANYAQRTVKVTTRREGSTGMVTYFARVIPGLAKLTMRATATAKGEGGCNLLPVAGQPPSGTPEFVAGCTEYFIKQGGGSGIQGSFGALDMSQVPCAGDQCRKPDGKQQNGGIGFRCRLTNGYPCCIDSSGSCLPSEQGATCGNSAIGIHERFLKDTDQRDLDCYNDYTGNGMRYVTVPITAGVQPNEWRTKPCFPLIRYGRFFLTKDPVHYDQCNIYANFMGYEDAGGSSSGSFHVFLIK